MVCIILQRAKGCLLCMLLQPSGLHDLVVTNIARFLCIMCVGEGETSIYLTCCFLLFDGM